MIPWLRANLKNYDIVIVNGLWNYATFAARRALVGSRTPYVVFPHGMLDPWFSKAYPLKALLKQIFWWFCEGPLLNNAGAVLFTTEDERTVAKDAFWPYRLQGKVASYGTADVSGDVRSQIAAFQGAVPQVASRKYLLYLSRIHKKKGCDLLVEAFAEAVRAGADFDLVMAGPDQSGWVKELSVRAEKLGVADRIHWPGMLKGDVKWGAFHGAEGFVLPSHQENFGIAVAEAMACANPVLISDKVNIWREVADVGGGLVEPDTLAGTSRLLSGFMALDEAMRKRMGEAARAAFLAKFEIHGAVASITAELERVRKEGPRSRVGIAPSSLAGKR